MMGDEKVTSPAGTFVCLFCSGVISMRSGDSDKFRMHMEVYHEVFSHFEIILALNFLKEDETNNIIKAVEHRIDKAQLTGALAKQELLEYLGQDVNVVYGDEEDISRETSGIEEANVNDNEDVENRKRIGNSLTVIEDIYPEKIVRKNVVMENGEPIEDNRGDLVAISSDDTFPLTNDMKCDEKVDTLCYRCQRKFKDLITLGIHTRKKVCLKHFPCHLCGMKFLSVSKLKRHLQERKKSCSINVNNGDLKYEAEYADDEDEIMKQNDGAIFSCTVCQLKFKNVKSLQNHSLKKVCCR
jgi:hypothetical protein